MSPVRKPILPVNRPKSNEERVLQERAYFNQEGRSWLLRNIQRLGRGSRLLKETAIRTPAVKLKAFQLTHKKPSLQAAESIIHYCVNNIKFIEVSDRIAVNFYNTQTADDIVSGKSIPTFRAPRSGLLGCQTFVATAIALLRAATPSSGKISSVRAVRTVSPRGFDNNGNVIGMPHTIVTFKVDGKEYVADPFKQGYSFLGSSFIGRRGKTLITAEEISAKIAKLKKQGLWKETLDPSDHGINSFDKYIEEARITGEKIAREMNLEAFARELKRGV